MIIFKTVSVGTTPVKIAHENWKRIAILIFNHSDVTLYISTDPTAITTQGFFLPWWYTLIFRKSEGDDTEMSFWAQTTTGTATVRVIEVLR